ncbi:amidohydrolase family protein [Sphingosinithalassobacter portus]|uniref:amidohydrolase family protein n=1 Tax=Stakelama portus TaxID=2676234 RepID=UPI0011AB4103|nr:amidohydrolase family protein [Sphingosinithalassobacter portus]
MSEVSAAIEPPVIDAHAHVFTSAMPLVPTAWTKPDYDYAVESYVADLDAHGISFGVITAASLYGTYNAYTLGVLDRFPRLRATVMLDIDTGRSEIADLARRGVRGVRFQISPRDPLPDLTEFRFRRFLKRLADAGMHMELNLAGHQLAEMLPALDGIDVVVDHFGLLRSEGEMEGVGFRAMLKAIEQGRCHVKISAGFRLPPDRLSVYAARLLQVAGPEHLFWGSDAPFVGAEDRVTYRDTLDTLYRIVPDAADRRAMSDAALRFYFF